MGVPESELRAIESRVHHVKSKKTRLTAGHEDRQEQVGLDVEAAIGRYNRAHGPRIAATWRRSRGLRRSGRRLARWFANSDIDAGTAPRRDRL
jgi:hypothetical protein